MLRIDFNNPPLAWHEIAVVAEGQEVPVRLRYKLLSAAAVSAWNEQQYKLARAVEADRAAAYDELIANASPEKLAEIHAMLMERIVDWDLLDAATGEKAAVNPATLAAMLDRSAFYVPALRGLYEASGPSGAKKTASSG